MIKLARTCNNHSINLYSEAFGKLLLLNNKVDPGGEYPSHQDWIEIFERYELPADEIYLSDACGLSGSNLITANAMNTFHLKMLQELGEDTTLDILPQNGSEGNVSRFITDKRYRDRLWLKSGYVSGVLNYTGIFRSVRNDELYIFTIFVNHNNNKISKLREEIKQLLSDLVDSTG